MPPVTEADQVVFHDPGPDLDARARKWGHTLPDHGLVSLALFAGALAETEKRSRVDGVPDVATRAFSDRRHLLGDRIAHWAVPLLARVEQHDTDRKAARSARIELLDIGDVLRPAPALTAAEGLHVPGEDSYGPVDLDVGLVELASSLWSGASPGEQRLPGDLEPDRFENAATMWGRLAADHEGTGRLWLDLEARCRRTLILLRGTGNA